MWGSAFAVCVMKSSLTCQFEHSGKVRSGLIGNYYFHSYQVRPHFLCAALMSSQRTKQHAVHRLGIYAIRYESHQRANATRAHTHTHNI